MEEFNGVFFYSFRFWEALAIVEVDEVGCSIVLSSLLAFGAVPGEVSYFSTLKTSVRRVSRSSCIALEVILWSISLVAVGVLSSPEVVTSVVPSVVSSGQGSVSVYIHGDRGVVHPSRGI